MSKLRVLVVDNDAAELDRISNFLQPGGYSVLQLETMAEASEALDLQRFDAVLFSPNTPAAELAAFTSKVRQMEKNRRGETRTAILSYASGIADPTFPATGQEPSYIDAVLPDTFEPALLAKTLDQLSVSLSQRDPAPAAEEREELAVFDPEGFSELLGHNQELLDEIIGLFLDECGSQLQQMRVCLQAQDFSSLAKISHTLKGSLGTLHAHRARARAEALEIAATRQVPEACETNLDRLKADLDELLPLVIRMRRDP